MTNLSSAKDCMNSQPLSRWIRVAFHIEGRTLLEPVNVTGNDVNLFFTALADEDHCSSTSVDIEDHVCVEEHREEDRTRLYGDELKVVSAASVAVMHVDGRDHPRLRQRQGSPALFGHERSKLLRTMDVVSICSRREDTQKGSQSDHNQSFQSHQHILVVLSDPGGKGHVEGLEEQRGLRMVVDEK